MANEDSGLAKSSTMLERVDGAVSKAGEMYGEWKLLRMIPGPAGKILAGAAVAYDVAMAAYSLLGKGKAEPAPKAVASELSHLSIDPNQPASTLSDGQIRAIIGAVGGSSSPMEMQEAYDMINASQARGQVTASTGVKLAYEAARDRASSALDRISRETGMSRRSVIALFKGLAVLAQEDPAAVAAVFAHTR